MTRVADLNSELNTVARATSVDGGIVVIGSPKLDAGVDWGWLVELRTQDGAEVGHYWFRRESVKHPRSWTTPVFRTPSTSKGKRTDVWR